MHQVSGHPKDDFFSSPQEPYVNDDRMDQVGPKGETGQRCPDAPTQDASDDARDVDGYYRGVEVVILVLVLAVVVATTITITITIITTTTAFTSTVAFIQTQMQQQRDAHGPGRPAKGRVAKVGGRTPGGSTVVSLQR